MLRYPLPDLQVMLIRMKPVISPRPPLLNGCLYRIRRTRIYRQLVEIIYTVAD
ncbi:hypothetical protein D3C78_1838710 [compost metagenome]